MVFKKKFFSYLKVGEMEHPALNRLATSKQLSLFKHSGFWFAVDTYKELEDLNKFWNDGNPLWKIW